MIMHNGIKTIIVISINVKVMCLKSVLTDNAAHGRDRIHIL